MMDEETRKKKKAAVEAILFAMGDAVETERLAKVLELTTEEITGLLTEMMAEYEEEGRGIRITPLEDGYQLCTKKEYYGELIALAKTPRKITLTDILMETLSIIAYRQPVTKMEIEKIRGVRSDHAVNKLVEYGLVEECGRLDAPGRPILFQTTALFLRHFGISSTADLPPADPAKLARIKEEAVKEADLQLKV